MKILYGIQGTGNGHLARARALVPALRKAGIEMDFVFSGRAREDFFNMEVFGPDFKVFQGLSLITDRGQLKTLQTLYKNNLIQFVKDVRSLDLKAYDLVVCDFEPVTAWAAKLQGIPSIGISHQCAFDYSVPKVDGYLSAKLLMKVFAPTAKKIGLHWHHFNQAVLPPLIEPMEIKPKVKNKILVYMGFESVDDIVNLLTPFKNKSFIVYAKVNEPSVHGHILVKPLSHSEFHNDLEECEGVISNAGFELASECLQLGKKLLMKPLLGQYEQLCNALALQSLNRATIMHSLDQDILNAWLDLPDHRPADFPDVATALADWLATGAQTTPEELATQLWGHPTLDYNANFGNKIRTGIIV